MQILEYFQSNYCCLYKFFIFVPFKRQHFCLLFTEHIVNVVNILVQIHVLSVLKVVCRLINLFCWCL